jgi:SAM-dependent methyltransferase
VTADAIQWDVATWKYALRFWTERLESVQGRLALEIGSRDGGLSLFLALRGCQVVCSDLDGPTPQAIELHRRYGVADRISYASVDACAVPFPDEHFDLVVFKSVLGALRDQNPPLGAQRTAVSEMHRVLKDGGRLLFAENLQASPLHTLLRERFVRWGRDWRYLSHVEISELLSGFTETDLSCRGFASAFGRREWQRSLLHGVDRLAVPLVPVSWRYVAFGVAVK